MMAASSSPDNSIFYEQFRALREELDVLNKREDYLLKKQRKVHRLRSSVAHRLDLMEKSLQPPLQFPINVCSTKRAKREKESIGQCKTSSASEDVPLELPRFLFVSNGCAICLLDLKHRENIQPLSYANHVPPLPKIAALKLIEKQLPVSVGLFKLGSDVYMIGGEEFPAAHVEPYESITKAKYEGSDPNKCFLTVSLKGTSRAAYRLSLSDNHTTLTASRKGNKIKKMKSPKLWPVVEEIDGKIHVFDSAPRSGFLPALDWIFSHEVLERDGDLYRWRKIPTTEGPVKVFITSHLVLGKRIFGVGGGKCVVFDSETEKWEAEDDEYWLNGLTALHVRNILARGVARCVGVFPLGEGRDPLYVVIGVVERLASDYENDDVFVYALAYLVTSTGQVICSQRLGHFFEGAVEPFSVMTGKIIKEGNTVCSVVNANALLNRSVVDSKFRTYVFINTFTVEVLTDDATLEWVGRHYDQPRSVGGWGEFVRLHMKKSYIYKTEFEFMKQDDLNHFAGVQACLL